MSSGSASYGSKTLLHIYSMTETHSLTAPNAGENVEQRELSSVAAGNAK
jgi:hypothetical protein